MSTKASVFISYAHADEAWLERLRAHLAPLRQLGMIEEWHDRSIAPGSLWETEIAHELDRATVILALVSPSFINSAYIGGVEMSRAFERHARGEARIVPIILRPVDWEATRIGQLQALPRDGRAVLSHRDRDQALRDVARGLRRLLSTTSAPEASASFSDTAMVEAPLYLNHTSFLRPEKQREFQERTGIPIDHYDIRVIVDCDDESRLDAVKRVEYQLDDAYPEPIRIRTERDRHERFLLKELANGEYLLRARVHLSGSTETVALERYITLWSSGPEL